MGVHPILMEYQQHIRTLRGTGPSISRSRSRPRIVLARCSGDVGDATSDAGDVRGADPASPASSALRSKSRTAAVPALQPIYFIPPTPIGALLPQRTS